GEGAGRQTGGPARPARRQKRGGAPPPRRIHRDRNTHAPTRKRNGAHLSTSDPSHPTVSCGGAGRDDRAVITTCLSCSRGTRLGSLGARVVKVSPPLVEIWIAGPSMSTARTLPRSTMSRNSENAISRD